MGHLISNVDSPRPVVPVPTGMRMPGSFGCGDGDDAVDRLILGIRELGVKDNFDWKGAGETSASDISI